MVRPHVALITTVEPVHLEYLQTVEAIAEAKAEIFAGLVPGGTAVLPRDNPHFPLLRERASAVGGADRHLRLPRGGRFPRPAGRSRPQGLLASSPSHGSQRFPYRVGAPGEHYVRELAGRAGHARCRRAPMPCAACRGLARVSAPVGRGARTLLDAPDGQILLIDESYNANPASMRAALAAMAATPREAFARRVAVLGDMLELGEASEAYHRGLKEAVDAAGVDLVLACGPMMRLLLDDLPPRARRLGADLGRARGRLARQRAGGRRGNDQGLARHAHGTAGRRPCWRASDRRGREGDGCSMRWSSFSDQIGPLNVFRYITFRTGGAIITALLFVFLFGPAIIDLLRAQAGQGPADPRGRAGHATSAKKGTPTMGGLMILSGVTVSTLLWANLANWYVWIVLFVTLSYGAIGFYDDYLKVTKSSAGGVSGKLRLLAEVVVAGIAAWAVMRAGSAGLLLLADGAVLQERACCRWAASVRPARHPRDRRRRQRRQPHRRPRRPGHRAGDDRGGDLRPHRLSDRQRQLRALPADPLRAGRRRAGRSSAAR